ncbi:hypothetical protein ACI68E_003731 [Malassezia pachydermatis]|uniref:Peroxisomal biogenesis factor 11 n=1 Tax=Malassezia pachydermatis TaxID=77020 RepID=A0A0M8MIU9_9BASI|nr:hypothetical protein Malapachy_0250 [Malassezia pachydermatis]KOS13336.1 hypothetical protein Malapachy_0250 [Malassezia pachydermatis]
MSSSEVLSVKRPFPLAKPVIQSIRNHGDLWKHFLTWEAADNGLQALRFSLLLMHVHARLRRPRKAWEIVSNPTGFVVTRLLTSPQHKALGRALLLASEGVANIRRLALLTLWIYTCTKELLARLRTGEDLVEEPPTAIEQFASLGEVTAHVGESFDVAAFLGGSGLFWLAFGMPLKVEFPPWFQRRRRGLERIGVFVTLVSLVLQLYTVHLRRKAITTTMFRNVRAMQSEMKRIDEDTTMSKKMVSSARERVEHEYTAFASQRRRLRWLGIERLCLYSDSIFTILEAWAPDEDKEMLEASTGLIASVLRLLRLWNEVRFGPLDI